MLDGLLHALCLPIDSPEGNWEADQEAYVERVYQIASARSTNLIFRFHLKTLVEFAKGGELNIVG